MTFLVPILGASDFLAKDPSLETAFQRHWNSVCAKYLSDSLRCFDDSWMFKCHSWWESKLRNSVSKALHRWLFRAFHPLHVREDAPLPLFHSIFFVIYHFLKCALIPPKLTCEPDLSVISFLPTLAFMITTALGAMGATFIIISGWIP